jgi:hypothetical protein
VEQWFNRPNSYLDAIAKYQIKDKNIHNFDETGVRVRCPNGIEVLVLTLVKELYSLSPEDRKSLTIIKDISALNVDKVPPVIIV